MIYKSLSAKSLALAKKIQNSELTEAAILRKLSAKQSLEKDRIALIKIAEEDAEHEQMPKKYTGVSGKKDPFTVGATVFLSGLLGYTFTVKLIEFLEARGQDKYGQLILEVPEAKEAAEQNAEHKEILNSMLNSGSMDATADAAKSITKMTVVGGSALIALCITEQTPLKAALAALCVSVAFGVVNTVEAYLSAYGARAGAAGIRTARMVVAQLAAIAVLFVPAMIIADSVITAVVTLILGLVIIAASSAYTSIAENSYFLPRLTIYSASFIILSALMAGALFGILKLL